MDDATLAKLPTPARKMSLLEQRDFVDGLLQRCQNHGGDFSPETWMCFWKDVEVESLLTVLATFDLFVKHEPRIRTALTGRAG
jgi:hypothetical protein